MPLAGVLLAFFDQERQNKNIVNISRRQLRDHSNPLSLPEAHFVAYYRLNKEAFQIVLADIEPIIMPKTSMPVPLQLATALRFLATGSYQGLIGKDVDINLHRTTVCKTLWRVISAMESVICPKWIKLDLTEEEMRQSKIHFSEKFRIPGVIGCMDGRHIKIRKPSGNEHLFYNRKGFFSINAMIICDYKMQIRCVDATKPGASHDAFNWNISLARDHFVSKYETGERGCWLLADSAYALEPFVLTPYKSPNANSVEHRFNRVHSSARNVIERVIGVLKSRFRCLLIGLNYTPLKSVKVINVCCALHNICRAYNLSFEDVHINKPEEEIEDDEDIEHQSQFLSDALCIRNSIAASLQRV